MTFQQHRLETCAASGMLIKWLSKQSIKLLEHQIDSATRRLCSWQPRSQLFHAPAQQRRWGQIQNTPPDGRMPVPQAALSDMKTRPHSLERSKNLLQPEKIPE